MRIIFSRAHFYALASLVIAIAALAIITGCPRSEEEDAVNLEGFIFETVGPQGEEPVDYQDIAVSTAEAEQINQGEYKAAILMHTSGDWPNAVIAGAEDAFATLGIEVVAITDAEFDSNKQRTDIETALALDPDIIITLIIDPVSGAEALRPAIEAGVQVVLLSNLPQDFVHGTDYASIVTDDLFNMGKSIAELIGEELNGEGNVGIIFHDASYYVTNQRDTAVEAVLARDFPDIDVVARSGLANPDDSEVIASALLTEFSDLDAIYAPWDGPAEGVVAALRAAGREDSVSVFTMDLGATNVLNMARGGSVKGVVADLPFDLGQTMANIGALATIGVATPAFVTVPAIKVQQNNIARTWERSLNRALPDEIASEL